MRKIFKVLKRDLVNIFKNPAAIVIVLGICIIPSLYAWISLKANWDPYINTGNLPVGVINEDRGTIVKDKILNVGDDVVNQLQQNKSIGWKFTTMQQGEEGLKNGEYYALIVIPQDFSQDLASLTTAAPVKPTLKYIVNDKTNIIATKITGFAKNELTKEIKTNFVKAVNEQAVNMANTLGEKLETNKPVLDQLKSVMNAADQRLTEIDQSISQSSKSADSLSSYLSTMKTDLPQITNQINTLQGVVGASKNLISSTQGTVNSLGNSVTSAVPEITSVNSQLQELLSTLGTLNTSVADKDKLKQTVNSAIGVANKLISEVQANINKLQSINSIFNNPSIEASIAKLQNVKGMIEQGQEQLKGLANLLDAADYNPQAVGDKLKSISDMSNNLTSGISSAANSITTNTIPAINSIGQSLTSGLTSADSLLESSKSIVPQLNSLANFGINTSDTAVEKANQLKDKLNSFSSQLATFQNKVNGVDKQSLDNLIELLNKNPETISSFLASPIEVKQENVYGTYDFGVGLTPFYTVLAIWVGSLLLTSLFTVHAEDFEDGTKLNLMQKHFGKLLLFVILSLIQTTIVTVGDKFILGLNPANMWLMLGMAWICSLVFTFIIFTLVSLFGNFGKALCIVIMVFQIAGSGGIYPIQTNPKIFGDLQFLWPFTYAIDSFREAIAGPNWSMVNTDIKVLAIFAVIFLILGFAKPLVNKSTEFMEEKFKESGL